MRNKAKNVTNGSSGAHPGPQARVVKVDPSHDMEGGVKCRACGQARGELLEVPCSGSNAAVLCSFMESKPAMPAYWISGLDSLWWELVQKDGGGMAWVPITLTLDKVRLVELKASLVADLFDAYEAATFLAYEDRMRAPGVEGRRFYAQTLMTLSAADKIAVLGPILRPLVVQAAGGL